MLWSGAPLLKAHVSGSGNTEQVYVLQMSDAGDRCVSCLSDSRLVVVDYEYGKVVNSATTGMRNFVGLKKSSDAEFVVVDSDGRGLIWDIRGGNVRLDTHLPKGITAFDFDEERKCSAFGIGSRVLIWNMAEGKMVRSFNDYHSDQVVQVCFGRGGKKLVSAGDDGLICSLRISKSSGRELSSVINCENTAAKVSYLPSTDKFCFFTGTEGAGYFHYGASEYHLNFEMRPPGIDYLVESLDMGEAECFLAGDASGKLALLDVNGFLGDEKIGLWGEGGHTEPVRCGTFNRERNLLASGAEDGTICVWRPVRQTESAYSGPSRTARRVHHSSRFTPY